MSRMGEREQDPEADWITTAVRSASPRRILFASADISDFSDLASALSDRAIEMTTVESTETATQLMQGCTFDAVVLDSRLATPHPIRACRQMVALNAGPVLFLADAGGENERVAALDAGAEDCADRTCSPTELAARVRAVARRGTCSRWPGTAAIRVRGWRLDLRTQSVTAPHGATTILSSQMLHSLMALMEHSGEALSPDQLNTLIEPKLSKGQPEEVDWRVRVHRLRSALRTLDPSVDAIRCIRGRGYAFAPWASR